MSGTKDKSASRLKCRFCDWTTVKGYTAKDGKFKGVDKAQQRLLDHVSTNHPTEWEAVQSALAEEEVTNERHEG